MKKKDIESLIFIGLLLVAAIIIVLVTAAIAAPAKRSSKADKVDLSCVTEPGKNPLKDCKQNKEYALECGPQYVKLPKEKCEIKEHK